MPAHADAEVLARRAGLARAVRDDLAAAGLPLAPQDLDPTFAVGARVYVDPLDDESGGGVFVAWSAHFVLATYRNPGSQDDGDSWQPDAITTGVRASLVGRRARRRPRGLGRPRA